MSAYKGSKVRDYKPEPIPDIVVKNDCKPEKNTKDDNRTGHVGYEYHYGVLDDAQRAVYRQIFDAVINNRSCLSPSCSRSEVMTVIEYLSDDYPSFFHIRFRLSEEGFTPLIVFIDRMMDDGTYRKAYDTMCSSIVVTGDEIDIEKAVRNRIMADTRPPCQGERDWTADNAYGVLVNHVGTDEGIARAISFVLNRNGVRCTVIRGLLDGMPHVWDLVLVGKSYGHMDPTLDVNEDGSPSYIYFNLTDKRMALNHKWSVHTHCTDPMIRYLGENSCRASDLVEAEDRLSLMFSTGKRSFSLFMIGTVSYTLDVITRTAEQLFAKYGTPGTKITISGYDEVQQVFNFSICDRNA